MQPSYLFQVRLFIIFICFFLSILAKCQNLAFLKVHFIYGSKPLKAYKQNEKKWFGGLMGGHVGIEGDSGKIADFLMDGKFHVFASKKSKHSRYNKGSINSFYKIFGTPADNVKKAIVYIPVTIKQKQQFESIVNSYLVETPYDYAFIGMRCAASTYDLLAQINVLPRYSYANTLWKIFYPKKLRKLLLKKAKENNWIVDSCEGSCRRKWEQD